MTLVLAAETVDKIGPSDWADLQRLHDEGWHVEEVGMRVVAHWEDLGVFVERELGFAPWHWMAWLGDDGCCYSTGNTLAAALAGLEVDLQSTAAQIAKFREVVL